ncbi:myosin-9-like [Neocloeon triangulifer]|uniref:myosin-9-like n=1 Tax=Neocloeon triangulifer TaxID=2078957 RepID=UPI00286F804F|nr:myosin-9-like [Neocloeon triangulifer]
MEPKEIPNPDAIGAKVLSRETILETIKNGPVDFINRRHITCNVDLSPLVKEEEMNYLRLRYNEYLLQMTSGPVDLSEVQTNLGQRQEEAEAKEKELQRLRDEMHTAEEERRNSAELLSNEAQEHRRQVQQLEEEIEGLGREIGQLKEGCGAGARRQMQTEVDGTFKDLEHLEGEVELKLLQIKNLEAEAEEKDTLLQNTRAELESILNILKQLEDSSSKRIGLMKEAIGDKESQLSELNFQIGALEACKRQLQTALEASQSEAKSLRENVDEKEKIIETYRSNNQKITSELEWMKEILNQNELGVQNELDQVSEQGNDLNVKLTGGTLSKEEQLQIQQRLAQLEEELEEKRKANEEAKVITENMASEIQVALDILDASSVRLEELVRENGALKTSSAKTISDLQQRNSEVERTLAEVRDSIDSGTNGRSFDGNEVGRAVREKLDSVLDTLKKTNENVNQGKFEENSTKTRISESLRELDAADASLMAVEDLLLSRNPTTAAPTGTWSRLENFFVRYYPVMLTVIFLALVVSENIFYTGSWNMWVPYFLFSALSFALPHPFGAIASLLAALVVTASFFV